LSWREDAARWEREWMCKSNLVKLSLNISKKKEEEEVVFE